MRVSRRHFAGLGAAFLGFGATTLPVFPDGPPPIPPLKKNGGTTTGRKPVKCCIDNKKLNAVKRKIRDLAREHNRLARRNKELRKLAEQGAIEINTQVSKTSGLIRDQLRAAVGVESSLKRFLRPGKDFSDEINLVGNRLSKAELTCDLASKATDCRERKRRMNTILRELTHATKDLQKIRGLGVSFTYVELGRLPKPLTSKLRKTLRFLHLADSRDIYWTSSVAKAKKEEASMKDFKAKMLAGC